VPLSGSRVAGCAPGLVPCHGHVALIPDASGRLCALGLRVALVLRGIACSAHSRRTLLSVSRIQPNRLHIINRFVAVYKPDASPQ